LVAIGVISGIATVIGVVWAVYTYYKPRTPQQVEAVTIQHNGPRLAECLPANIVNEAAVFMDWVQKAEYF
jgi:hypothetical protein